MRVTGGTGRRCSPQLPASRCSHGRNRGNRTIFSASLRQSWTGVPHLCAHAQAPEAGAPPPFHRDSARGLGSCSPERSASPRAPASRTPGPGGQRGAAWGEGVADGPLNLQGRSEGRSRGRRHAGLDSAPQPQGAPGGAYRAPYFPGPSRDHRRRLVPRARGLAGRGLQTPTRAGAGLSFPLEPPFPRARWSRGCLHVAALPRAGTHSGLSLAWPLDRPNCSVAPSPAPSGERD